MASRVEASKLASTVTLETQQGKVEEEASGNRPGLRVQVLLSMCWATASRLVSLGLTEHSWERREVSDYVPMCLKGLWGSLQSLSGWEGGREWELQHLPTSILYIDIAYKNPPLQQSSNAKGRLWKQLMTVAFKLCLVLHILCFYGLFCFSCPQSSGFPHLSPFL